MRVDRRRRDRAGAAGDRRRPAGRSRAGIAYSPGLPARKARAAARRCSPGTLTKAEAVYTRPFWRDAGLSGQGVSDVGPARTTFDNSPPDASVGVLFGFIGGARRTRRGARCPAASAGREVLEDFAAFFGDAGAHARSTTSSRTGPSERWTRGCPVAHVAPGVLRQLRAVRCAAPAGRVHWAGTETADYWLGYMDGAVRSGERAAGEVLARCAADARRAPAARLVPGAPRPSTSRSRMPCSCGWRAVSSRPTVRLYRPAPTVAFGRLDALRPGFAEAGEAARDAGFPPIVRLAGGHAAAYHERSLIYEEIVPERDVTAGLHERFRDAAELLAEALAGPRRRDPGRRDPRRVLPGAYTVSAAGRIKLVGSAQRAVRGGSLLSAFILVGGGDRLRGVLFDVYRALEIAWQPATAGALDDVAPGVSIEAVEGAVLAARGEDRELTDGTVDPATLGAGARRSRSAIAGPTTEPARSGVQPRQRLGGEARSDRARRGDVQHVAGGQRDEHREAVVVDAVGLVAAQGHPRDVLGGLLLGVEGRELDRHRDERSWPCPARRCTSGPAAPGAGRRSAGRGSRPPRLA